MFCSKCGKEIQENASFCPYCGNPVNGTAAAVNPGGQAGQRDPVLDRPADKELMDRLYHAQDVVHAAETHLINYSAASDRAEMKKLANSGFLNKIITFVVGYILVCAEICVLSGTGAVLTLGNVSFLSRIPLIVALVIINIVSFMVLRAFYRSKSTSPERKVMGAELAAYEAALENNRDVLEILPQGYWKSEKLDYIVELFTSRRVSTLREALEKCDMTMRG